MFDEYFLLDVYSTWNAIKYVVFQDRSIHVNIVILICLDETSKGLGNMIIISYTT